MNIPHVSPIGTSMVHLLGAPSCNPIHPSTTLPTTTQHTPESPCLLLPRDSKRLLLQGPDRSGRSSMVMNLAYASSCAATAPCHCLLRPCRCTNAVIYRKSQASPPPDDFPMPCRFTGHTKKDCNGHVQDDWDPDSLRRIRIEYVSSAHEILQDLLRMPGKPWQDQPTQAILIDDLDLICGNDNDIRARSSGGSESLISSMQTLAVAVDTSHALQRLHGRLPVVLASVSLKAKVVAPWMDTIVTLTSCSSSIGGSDSARQGSRTAWKAEFSGRFPRSSGIQWSAVIDYTISNDTVDGPLIEWK